MGIFDVIKYPPKEFSPAAFWFWYGALNTAELRRQIDLMVEQGVHNGFMHPRAYLETPYLEDDWWDAISACVDESEKKDFYPWIYDEYAWPSGTAGNTFEYSYQKPSRTLSNGKNNMAKSLILHRFSSVSEYRDHVNREEPQSPISVILNDGTEFRRIDGATDADGEIFAFYVKVHPTLVDYMNKETIREFMNYTHEEYKKRFGEYFGRRIPGVFFDEIYLNHFVPWTDKLPEEFEARRGYDLLSCLYALAIEGGDRERNIRRDFYKTVAELYEEAFFDRIGLWCQENGLKLTGHTEEDVLLHPSRQGNYFNTVRHLQIPGSDCHDYRYRFPRKITYREPKLSVSVSRVYGKERAMSEAFGGAGYACTLQEFKRGVNTAGAMGISMFTLHGFYSNLDSQAAQSDWSGNFFYQNPYWRYFKHFADYISRICYINSQGEPVVDVALYYPIEEMQRETYIKGVTKTGRAIDSAFNTVLNCLIENQTDTDIIDSESLLQAEISSGKLCIGSEKFSVILLPDAAELSLEVSNKLESFKKAGGKVLYYSTKTENNPEYTKTEEIYLEISKQIKPDVRVTNGEKSDLYVNHRKIENMDFYFVANSAPKSKDVTLTLREKGFAKRLSAEDGELSSIDFRISEEGTTLNLSLGEDEGVWIVIDTHNKSEKYEDYSDEGDMLFSGKWEFLPISETLEGGVRTNQDRAEMDIPLAFFSSNLHGEKRLIRIQNRESEHGCVGRHLSIWNGGWITRRVGWKDSSSSNNLYFRRSFTIDKKPYSARMCLCAINEWVLYINGEKVTSSQNGFEPTTLDVANYLHEGENVICISVHNPTPMPKATLLQRDELISKLMISLLAEIEVSFDEEKLIICTDSEWDVCEAVSKDWINIDFKPEIFRVDFSSRQTQAPALKNNEWSKAWERGNPPIKPFGDLPRFDETVEYPQKICYGIMLPCGTEKVNYPCISGRDIEILIDGVSATFNNGQADLIPDGKTHSMQISLLAENANDGLKASVSVEIVPQKVDLGDWRAFGLEWYSGFALYKNNFRLDKKDVRYVLDLGRVFHQAEVWVNNKKAGERVWSPYKLDITEHLEEGDNEISVIVSNSAGVWRQFALLDEGEALGWNRYWNYDNIQRDKEKLISGLIGPVRILKQNKG